MAGVLRRAECLVFAIVRASANVNELRDKLQNYFRVPSVQHYLIADPDTRVVIHHARGHDDVMATRMVSEGCIPLDPPGLTLALPALFGAAPQAP
jgi:Uma2 family endonuclease